MSTKKSLIVSWFVLFLTVPWWFNELAHTWFNLPDWGLYAMITAIFYSLLLAFIIQKVWETQDNE